MRSLLLSLAVTCCVASTARAQDFEAAGKHFGAAQDAFGKKHYRQAATEFEAAYAITHDPVLLYNIAESYEKSGDGQKAAASYQSYLKEQPEAQDKAEVQRRIRTIEARHFKLADQSAPDEAPTPPPAPVTPPATTAPTPSPESSSQPSSGAITPATPPVASATTPEAPATPAPAPATVTPPPAAETPPPGLLDEGPLTKMRVAAWIGVATTLALVTAGAIFGLAAQSRGDDLTRQLTFVDTNGQPNTYNQATDAQLASLRSDGNLYNGLAIGFYSAAAASAVVTTVLFVVDARRPKHREHARRLLPAVTPTVAKSGAGLAAEWRF
jgi:tetratricopeptide (TPR) repeat protein